MTTKTPQYNKVLEFLQKHPMGILSTVGEDSTPWGAAIYYIVDEDFNFYFVTRSETFKYQNIKNNSGVALTIADPETQQTVQLSGKVSTMPVQKYMDVFFDKFAAIRPEGDYKWAPPVDKLQAGKYVPLQIIPTKLQYADYGKNRIEVHGDYIEQIISS